jgi:hypothetical protein
MNRRQEILEQLLRIARKDGQPAEMPFGFDTRVLACVKAAGTNGSALIALFARRAMAVACAVIALAAAGLYGAVVSETNADATNEYGMIDSAIQTNLTE